MYEISITRSAAKELRSIPKHAIKRIVDNIDLLAQNPRPEGSKKIKGTKLNLWRIRIGNYQVVYDIQDKIKIIEIIKIGHRKEIYE
ncbi:MAG: type II toxin-antitoxin system RelE/ParE family toxin [Chitinophagaceae bacterium]|nr:MAG: type II toxin-antitoxin system RelE/ParE family toxin [Chitinophagaceae bacterium]